MLPKIQIYYLEVLILEAFADSWRQIKPLFEPLFYCHDQFSLKNFEEPNREMFDSHILHRYQKLSYGS